MSAGGVVMGTFKCVRCNSDDVSISNVDGLRCLKCGAWFDVDEDTHEILWAFDHLPRMIEQDEFWDNK